MKSTRGFTLIELLVTISIIALLTATAGVAYSGIRQRGRDAQRVSDLNVIKVALTVYYNAQVPNAFVSSPSALTINNSSDAVSTALKPNYIREVPLDPLNTGNNIYKYQSFNSAKDFTLFGTLENKSDKKGWGGGSSWAVDGYQVKSE